MLISNILATINLENASFGSKGPANALFAYDRSGLQPNEVYGRERYRIPKIIPEKKRILWLKSFADNGGRI